MWIFKKCYQLGLVFFLYFSYKQKFISIWIQWINTKIPWIKQLMTPIGSIIFVWLAVLGEAVLSILNDITFNNDRAQRCRRVLQMLKTLTNGIWGDSKIVTRAEMVVGRLQIQIVHKNSFKFNLIHNKKKLCLEDYRFSQCWQRSQRWVYGLLDFWQKKYEQHFPANFVGPI